MTPFELPVALSRRQNRKPRVSKRCNDKSIDPRSAEVAQRIQFGHWESDTVLGRKKKGEPVAFTIVEGLTVFYLTIRISEKTSDGVAAAMQQLYSEFENRFSQIFRIITTDNGSGLAAFFRMEAYGTQAHFVHLYSSWERPVNERSNRILRRFIPKESL